MRVSVFALASIAFALPSSSFGNAAEFVEAVTGGVAANISAASPAIGAGILAKADVDIASINSEAMKYMANVAAQTSMYQAATAAAIARAQGSAMLDIFRIQQNGVNYRMDRQLAELRDARKDALKFQMAGLEKQWQFQDRYLDILAIQGQNNARIARLALDTQKSVLGLQNDSPTAQLTVTGNPALGGFGATGSPATLQVSARRPQRVTLGAAVARYPGRAHAASGAASAAIRPLSTHSAF